MKFFTAITLLAAAKIAGAFSPTTTVCSRSPQNQPALHRFATATDDATTSSASATECLQKLVDVANKRWISMDDLFDQADVDKSGDVSKEEMEILLNQVHLTNSVNFDMIWSSLDEDNSGEVTRKEWHDCFSQIEPSKVSAESVAWKIKPSYRDDVPGGLVALVAHNKMKGQMASFVEQNVDFFKHCRIITTGSTGKTLEGKLGLEVHQKVASGPLGGDQEIGALVTQGLVSAIFFFKDPLNAHQHAADIEALTRICDVHNVPYATNSASGKSLVTAMAALGLAFANDDDESDTVKEYKSEQQMIIQKVSQSDGTESTLPSL